MIFVVIGSGSIWFTWRTKRNPTVTKRVALNGRLLAVLLFTVFLLLSSLATHAVLIRHLVRLQQVKSWAEIPCVVVSSRVQSHSGHDSTTYSVDILYEYQINGRACRSKRYDFMEGSSSGYDSKAEVVRRYPTGWKAVCYVNPVDSSEVVFSRKLTPMMLLGLIPVVFVLVGVGGLVWLARGVSRRAAARPWSGGSAGVPV